MTERHVSFKKALNDAVRDGAVQRPRASKFATRTADLGVPAINLDRALQITADLEDEELIRRQRRGGWRSSMPTCFSTRRIRRATITRHAEILGRMLAVVGAGANLVNDAHLAALAIEHRGSVVSYDSGFGRFPGVRWHRTEELL